MNSGFSRDSHRSRDAGKALDVVLGSSSPFNVGAPSFAVPLAIFSWLLVPAVIGALVAALLSQKVSDATLSESEVNTIVHRASTTSARERGLG